MIDEFVGPQTINVLKVCGEEWKIFIFLGLITGACQVQPWMWFGLTSYFAPPLGGIKLCIRRLPFWLILNVSSR